MFLCVYHCIIFCLQVMECGVQHLVELISEILWLCT